MDIYCVDGTTCFGGKCIDNECLDAKCESDKICSKGDCIYKACLNKEACAIGKTCNISGECEFIIEPAIKFDSTSDKTTDESGKSLLLSLRLNNQPSKDVLINCNVITSSSHEEVNVDCSSIKFNASNWQQIQTIQVTGVDDYIKDGDQTYKIKVTTISEDVDFDALTATSVELKNIDKTTPGFIVSETSLTTYEDQVQEGATFTIALSSIPSADVRIVMSSSNSAEGTVSPSTITFTKNNWNVPQTMSVKGVDDQVRDGNINYTIFSAPAESNDEDYDSMQIKPIKVTNVDDDVSGVSAIIPPDGFTFREDEEYPIHLRLNTKPKKDVKITLKVSDETEAEFTPSSVVLSPENWKDGVALRIEGVEDNTIDGDQPVKLSMTVSSDDEDYNLNQIIFDATVKDTDTADIRYTLGDAPVVKEGTGVVAASVTLASKPMKDVSVDISLTDQTELKVNKSKLTFKANYWDMPADIFISSVDDNLVDGDIRSSVILKSSSADKNFNNGQNIIEVTTVDDDMAELIISSNPAAFSENSGAATNMTVALSSQPNADVKVTASSSDASELAITSNSVLTFNSSNWNQPQIVSVRVVDDLIADGTQIAYVRFNASSTDKNFHAIVAQSAQYWVIDDDSPAITLTIDDTALTYSQSTTSAKAILSVQPSSDVSVRISSSDASITATPNTLTFTTSNWNVPQSFDIRADFSGISIAKSTGTIEASGSGGAFSGVKSNKLTLNLTKVPTVQTFNYTGKIQTVDLPKGRYKLEAWGAQGGTQGQGIGGKGGYATGVLNLSTPTKLYIQVGGLGQTGGGYNGGGASSKGAGGGGATHIALQDGLLTSFKSNYSSKVYLVAGGGGGGAQNGASSGGYGGGNAGGAGAYRECGIYGKAGTGGTQTAGGQIGTNRSDDTGGTNGSFGQGGTGSVVSISGGGGGGGLFGGGGGEGGKCNAAGGGGSSYVSTSLTNTQTISGNSLMPSPFGGTEVGHTGEGYVRITLMQ